MLFFVRKWGWRRAGRSSACAAPCSACDLCDFFMGRQPGSGLVAWDGFELQQRSRFPQPLQRWDCRSHCHSSFCASCHSSIVSRRGSHCVSEVNRCGSLTQQWCLLCAVLRVMYISRFSLHSRIRSLLMKTFLSSQSLCLLG